MGLYANNHPHQQQQQQQGHHQAMPPCLPSATTTTALAAIHVARGCSFSPDFLLSLSHTYIHQSINPSASQDDHLVQSSGTRTVTLFIRPLPSSTACNGIYSASILSHATHSRYLQAVP